MTLQLRGILAEDFELHISHHIHQRLSQSRSGLPLRVAVNVYWSDELDQLCDVCMRKYFAVTVESVCRNDRHWKREIVEMILP